MKAEDMKHEILHLFQQLSQEEKAEYVQQVKAMLLKNRCAQNTIPKQSKDLCK